MRKLTKKQRTVASKATAYPYKCDYCNAIFAKAGQKGNHVKYVHPGKTKRSLHSYNVQVSIPHPTPVADARITGDLRPPSHDPNIIGRELENSAVEVIYCPKCGLRQQKLYNEDGDDMEALYCPFCGQFLKLFTSALGGM